jgi:hypothetical protein
VFHDTTTTTTTAAPVTLTAAATSESDDDNNEDDHPKGQDKTRTSGVVTSVADAGFALKQADGSTITVITDKDTKVIEPGEGRDTKSANIKAGDTVRVFGTKNADGSVTAHLVQVGCRDDCGNDRNADRHDGDKGDGDEDDAHDGDHHRSGSVQDGDQGRGRSERSGHDG